MTNAVDNVAYGAMHTGNAEELCSRIVSSGASIGFGNDPRLILAAREKISAARGVLLTAAAELEDAQTQIRQAHQQ